MSREMTYKMGYLALLCAFPIWVLFGLFGKWEKGLGATICAAAVFLVVETHWDLRRHAWFWITIVFALLLQAPLVFLLPWGGGRSAWVNGFPIALLGYAVAYGCVKLGEKFIDRNSTT